MSPSLPAPRRNRPVRPQLVQPRRRRTRHGLLQRGRVPEFLRSCPLFEEMLVRSGIYLIKYWFSVNDEEQERRFQERIDNPDQALEAQPDGYRVAQALGGVLKSQG